MYRVTPGIREDDHELRQRLQHEHDGHKKPRLQMLYLRASGPPHSRQDVAQLLGVHRHTIGRWLAIYAAGGLPALLVTYAPAGKSVSLAPAILASLEEALRRPKDFASYEALRQWVRRPQIQLLSDVKRRRLMASPNERKLTFLRGSGFLLSLVGVWDLTADASGQWPSQKGFLIFNETKITGVIERQEKMRRGIEGTYAVEGNRLIFTKLSIDTAPDQGPLGDAEFTIEGDILTITWLSSNPTGQRSQHADTFRRRGQPSEGVVLLPPVAIYASDAPTATAR